jgi:bifunctional non-homologous end joining protein LigD
MNKTALESASLYYKAGSSDKIYNATIEKQDDGYVVNFSYGRRGSALRAGSKTSSPVNLSEAKIIFDKLIKEKTSKGYQYVADSSISMIHVAENPAETPVSSKCVLLNPIPEEEVQNYIDNEDWVAQQKLDGIRFMLSKEGENLVGYNRKGLRANIPTEIWNNTKINKNFFIDGELVGENFYVFDILEYENENIREAPFVLRIQTLKSLISEINCPNILYTEVYHTKIEKKKAYEEFLKNNQEGIVFKKKTASYYVGRPASGGNYLKHKFYSTCSCVVKEINSKRSVALGLYDKRKFVDAGNVTIPINFQIPNVGDIVEIRYLYARKQSGSLYQPVYLGKRNDIDSKECVQSQLKYKADD